MISDGNYSATVAILLES